jgi:phosphatidylglycerophosphate synthase
LFPEDGQFARRYGLTSRFGDLYDHITDHVVGVLLLIVIVWRRGRDIRVVDVLLFVLLALLGFIHTGCQQRHYGADGAGAESLDQARVLCARRRWVHWTRFFGTGTFVLVVLLYVICLFQQKPRPPAA